MVFANTQMFGIDIGFPDVCKTPAPPAPFVPIPYPVFALGPMGVPPVPRLLIIGCPAHNLMTRIPLNNGDNAGVLLGMRFPGVMVTSRHTSGASTCLFGGQPATRMLSPASMNGGNANGVRLVPSQPRVLILSP